MSVLPAFGHARPRTVAEALGLLDDGNLPYHGGTEILAVMRLGLLQPTGLVDLKGLPELHGIARAGGALRIGAGTTHLEVGRDPDVRREVPVLARVADQVGNVRVRASGTVGGNLCFGEPRSDVATVLLALGASVSLRSAEGDRAVSLDEFCVGAYVTDLRPGELLMDARVPIGPRPAVYRKLQTSERPTVGVAAVAPGAGMTRYRVAVGAVSERPLLFEAERLDDFDPEALASGIDVVPGLDGAEDYKRHVTAVYLGRALAALAEEEAA